MMQMHYTIDKRHGKRYIRSMTTETIKTTIGQPLHPLQPEHQPRRGRKDSVMNTPETTDSVKTYTIEGHPPIRTKQEPEEHWLGYVYLDFGGEYLRGLKTRDGRLILWFRHNAAYDTERSYSRYIATLPPAAIVADLATARSSYRDLGKVLTEEIIGEGKLAGVMTWLAGLGFAPLAEID
jgi:hypothetical protein